MELVSIPTQYEMRMCVSDFSNFKFLFVHKRNRAAKLFIRTWVKTTTTLFQFHSKGGSNTISMPLNNKRSRENSSHSHKLHFILKDLL